MTTTIDERMQIARAILADKESHSHGAVRLAEVTMELTDEMRAALSYAISLAIEDQENWMRDGDPDVDYGDEWPEVAQEKSREWDQLALASVALGLGMEQRCEGMADDFREAAEEASEEDEEEGAE